MVCRTYPDLIEYPERPELRVVGLVRVVLGGDRRLQRPIVEHVLKPVVEVVVVLKHYQRQPGGGGQLEEQAEQYRPRTPLNAHLTYSLTIVIRVLASGRARGRNDFSAAAFKSPRLQSAGAL